MPKHDALCVTTSGLAFCWCMCASCWSGEGVVRLPKRMTIEQRADAPRKAKGRCTCPDCSCHELYPMPGLMVAPLAPKPAHKAQDSEASRDRSGSAVITPSSRHHGYPV